MAEASNKQSTTHSDVTNNADKRQQPFGVTVVIALVIFSPASIFAFKQSPRPDPFVPPTLWEKLFKPQERNALMRLAAISGDLSDVFVLPGSEYIWAVGKRGLIIHSQDGGETWQQQTFPGGPKIKPAKLSQSTSLFDQVTPIRAAYAMGGSDEQPIKEMIQQKNSDNVSNQARQFQEPAFEQKGESIKQEEQQIRQTQEIKKQIEEPPTKFEQKVGRITKKELEPEANGSKTKPPFDLEAIYFTDKKNGWIVGSQGSMFKTENGGITWLKLSSETTVKLNAVQFVDIKTGWVVGENRTILKTTNGGKRWVLQNHDTFASFSDVNFINSQTGFVVGDFETILKTTNGGMNWEVKNIGDDKRLRALAFADTNTGVAVGDGGTILKIRDGGESWATTPSFTDEPLFAIAFSDTNTGVAVGDSGTILKTSNGGESWTTKASNTNAWLYAVAFSDTNNGVAVGFGGTILKTNDGGESWATKTSGTNYTLYAIAFNDTSTGVAVGDNGTILKTSDGGKSWMIKYIGIVDPLTTIAFSDANTGVALGVVGTILKTRDGGENWTAKSSNDAYNQLSAVAFSDAINGIAVGHGGTILKTHDGGESWTTKTSGSNEVLTAIAFSNSNMGVTLGYGGTILKTNDGGESWSPPKYRRYPALWYWAVCVFFLLFALGLSMRQPGDQPAPTETVADILASDRPIQPGDPDPLNFGANARGLSRFMRNPATEPPLTVAITGAWDTGKSSLMNLLYYDLKQYGFTPVWFNAWHHQKGEQLLASLYANIRSQAIPEWSNFSGITPVGVLFRLNLFFHRSSKHWLLTCLLIALPIAVFTYLILHPAQLNGFDTNAVLKAATDTDRNKLIIALLSGLPPLAAFMRSLRAFGVNPVHLIALGSSEKDKSAHVDPNARQRFANEFKEVTECLELGRMVIFIDDLDRCSKENVVDILESINFLSVSGGCYIILGMDKGWVEVCIEQQFPEMKGNNHDFANEYLEKLINIDVPVPTLENEGSGKLLAPEPPEQKSLSLWETFRDGFLGKVSYYRYAGLVILLITISITFGYYIDQFYQVAPKQKVAKILSEIKVWEDVDIEDIDVINGQPRMLMSIGKPTPVKKKKVVANRTSIGNWGCKPMMKTLKKAC